MIKVRKKFISGLMASKTFRTLFISLSRKIIYTFILNIEKFHLFILIFGKLMRIIPRFCVGLQIISCMPMFEQNKHTVPVTTSSQVLPRPEF
jgi:hypothetical protein